ncbi:MAG TPA: MFS transporter [Candidatus Acidoferrales bacterium]|nr:MFS transporter [Candidatus Acidoferrales bacterium]
MDALDVGRPASIFANRSFRLYFAGQAASFIGDGLRTIALPLLVFHLTGSALTLGVTYALQFLPFALAGLVGGSLADRLDRRRLMLACTFIRLVVVVVLIAGIIRGFLTLGIVYASIVIISICAAVFLGGEASSIPFVLGKEKATQAVSVLIAAEQAANLVAPPIGGALFSLGGALPAFVVNALMYLLSYGSITGIQTLGPQTPGKLPSARQLLDDIRIGFAFLWADAAMRGITLLSLGLNLFAMMAFAIYIPFYKVVLGANDAQVGLTLGIGAIGTMLGSLLAGAFAGRWPFGASLCIAYALDALLFVPVVLLHGMWLVTLFWAFANLGAGFETAQIVSWRMRIIPQANVGRVFGAVRLIVLIGIVPGSVIGGYLAQLYGPRLPLVVATIGYLVLALGAIAIPAVRRDTR